MGGKILLVDDDDIFRSEFREAFEEYGVVEASNGQDALKILKKPNEIDVVILDVRMSGMNGIEVLTRIKELYPEVGIIIFTGYSSKDVAVEALRGKADDYIEKPMEIDATREVIDRLMEKKSGKIKPGATDAENKIERVKAFVQKNSFKKVGLKDAATAVCLSPKYLSRIFKEATGLGFNEYRLDLKIKQAKGLLKKSSYNVDQIADKMGYANTESFIRIFKKMTNRTPTEFRKELKRR